MPSLSPDGALQRLAASAYTPQDDVQKRLKALELQITLEYQRQRDQVEEELHELCEQLATMTANTSTGQRWSLYARLPKNYRRRSLRPCIISPKIRSVWPSMLRRRPAVPLSGCAMNSW
jgi:hypothetical protein